MGNVTDVVFFILTGLRIRRARRGEFILIIVRAIGVTSCFVYRCRGTGTCSAGTTSVSSWSDRRSSARVRHTRWRRLRGVGGTREWRGGRRDPRRRRPASCIQVVFAPRRRRYLAAPGDVLHAPLFPLLYRGTSVREPLRPGLDLVNAVYWDLHTARSSASLGWRIALGSSASRVQCHRSTLGPGSNP